MILDDLARLVARTLIARGLTLATSESLTGGLIGASLTAIPGSSAFYLGGVIAYATDMKAKVSGVDEGVLHTHGAVSEQAATEMALGIQEIADADWAIAVTGVAGPDPLEGHPAGEVWICAVGPRVGLDSPPLQAHLHHFEGDREVVREQTAAAALTLLLAMMSPVEN